MFSIKERATLAANIAGSMAATKQGWETSPKELVRIAEDILDEIDLMYRPKAIAEEKRFRNSQNEFFESFRYLL